MAPLTAIDTHKAGIQSEHCALSEALAPRAVSLPNLTFNQLQMREAQKIVLSLLLDNIPIVTLSSVYRVPWNTHVLKGPYGGPRQTLFTQQPQHNLLRESLHHPPTVRLGSTGGILVVSRLFYSPGWP